MQQVLIVLYVIVGLMVLGEILTLVLGPMVAAGLSADPELVALLEEAHPKVLLIDLQCFQSLQRLQRKLLLPHHRLLHRLQTWLPFLFCLKQWLSELDQLTFYC